MAENGTCTNVQKEMEKVWRERMDREDKITKTNIKTLRSEVRLEVMRLSTRLRKESCLHDNWAAEGAHATLPPT